MNFVKIFLIIVFLITCSSTTYGDSINKPTEISLEQAIEIAMEQNNEIQSLEKEVEAAVAAVRKAKASYLFNLSASGEMSKIDTFPDPESISIPGMPEGSDLDFGVTSDITKSLSFSFVQPVYTFGLIPASIRAAKESLKSRREELRQKRHEVSLAVIEAFYGVYLAERSVEIRQEEVERSELALKHAQTKFEVGQSPKFDVIRSEVDVAQATESLVSARKNAEIALLGFHRLLGTQKTMRPFFGGEIEIPLWQTPLDECLKTGLENRPEIGQLRAGIEAQNQVVKINRLRPSLNFIANLSYADQASSSFSGKNSWAWFLQFDVPLFDGGKSKFAVDEAQGNRDALKKRFDDTIALLKLDIESNYLALEEAGARVESSTRILAQADEALHMAEVGYREGVITYLDLVSSRNQYTQAELGNLKALTDYKVAYARMLKSIGSNPGLQEN